MQCPNCKEAASEGSVFCTNCGTRVSNKCPNCAVVSPVGSRFCRLCGFRLLETSTAAPASAVGVDSPDADAGSDVSCSRCGSVNELGALFCYSCGLPLDESRARVPLLFPAGKPAEFRIRMGAALLDWLIIGLPFLLVAILVGTFLGAGIGWLALLGLGAVYFTMGVSVWSATLGKRYVDISVLRKDGSKVGLIRAFSRWLCSFLSYYLLFVGVLMVAIRRDKRALHDLICDTVVVYRR